MRIVNMEGLKYGRLTVIRREDNESTGQARWLCRCDCGKLRIVRGIALRAENTRSCGCLNREVARDKMRKLRSGKITHGKSRTAIYRVWAAMLQRCTNPHDKGFVYYGGRGIQVCPRWKTFEKFFADMGERPSGKQRMTIERINNNANYEPANCKWATYKEQNNNNRCNRTYKERRNKNGI